MKIAAIFIPFLIAMFACGTAKKAQKSSAIITKTDTSRVVNVEINKSVDSTMLIKEVYNKVIKNKTSFTTFNAKVKVNYNSAEGNEDATAYVRLKKDSALWFSLRGPLGIEGFRILITKDSIKVINLLKKNFQYRGISSLKQFTGIPFDFMALQDLVVGNPVFIDSNIQSYHTDSSNHLQVLMLSRIFSHLITIDNTNFTILHSKLDDVNEANRSCDIDYSVYDSSSGVPFSTFRKISVSEPAKADIQLDFKQHSFNQPVTFPFNVSANYKKL